MIYSGPGGTILRKDILSAGPKFIHVHPGWLPDFKGSTTIYYSMLINSEVGASVIFFEEGIDEGPVLFQRKYKITERDIDFDYVLDPLVRTKTLIEFFRKGELNHEIQEKGGNTYFIIHPLLKHCAIISHKSKS
jgi:methionyl-tRNA formyltransferase